MHTISHLVTDCAASYIGKVKTSAGETFPLAWERRLWSGVPVLPARLVSPRTEYDVTDFRLVVRCRGRTVREMVLEDIHNVTVTESW